MIRVDFISQESSFDSENGYKIEDIEWGILFSENAKDIWKGLRGRDLDINQDCEDSEDELVWLVGL